MSHATWYHYVVCTSGDNEIWLVWPQVALAGREAAPAVVFRTHGGLGFGIRTAMSTESHRIPSLRWPVSSGSLWCCLVMSPSGGGGGGGGGGRRRGHLRRLGRRGRRVVVAVVMVDMLLYPCLGICAGRMCC